VPDVSVVVVTWNALPWLEQCLESVRGRDIVVVDHGSTDGTVDFVRERFPEARLIQQENKGMGGGNNAGMRAANGRYFFLLNSDAWVVNDPLIGDALDRLIEFADEHPEAAVVGPRLLNTDGTLQRSVRGEPTLWRLATEYLFIRKLAPRSKRLNPLYRGDFDHERVAEVDWLFGPALLVRREAADAVGLFDENFFMFSEEVDWMTRFRRAGWTAGACTSRTSAGISAGSRSTAERRTPSASASCCSGLFVCAHSCCGARSIAKASASSPPAMPAR
jgi:N-acetylglucosaminyl-diphospho-decaprenol L-rhamnosyltransferase